jgi:hypothetical protein
VRGWVLAPHARLRGHARCRGLAAKCEANARRESLVRLARILVDPRADRAIGHSVRAERHPGPVPKEIAGGCRNVTKRPWRSCLQPSPHGRCNFGPLRCLTV